jgi:hypothetical protein
MNLSVVCSYRRRSLVDQIAPMFDAAGANVHLWALDEELPSVSKWTCGAGIRTKILIWNELYPHYQAADIVLFTDDDIEFPADFVQTFFDCVARVGADWAQPALSDDSHHAIAHTLRRQGMMAREVNWVDQMVFSMSGRFLQRVSPMPDFLGPFGWGVEQFWAPVLRNQAWRAAVIDACPVRHAFRPIAAEYSYWRAYMDMIERCSPHVPVRPMTVLRDWPEDGPPRAPQLPTNETSRAFLQLVHDARLTRMPEPVFCKKLASWEPTSERAMQTIRDTPENYRAYSKAAFFLLEQCARREPDRSSAMLERLYGLHGEEQRTTFVNARLGFER